MAYLPKALLRRLYVKGSMKIEGGALSFKLRNSLATATVNEPLRLKIDGLDIDPSQITIKVGDKTVKSSDVSETNTFEIPVGTDVEIIVPGNFSPGKHKVVVEVTVKGYGKGSFDFEDEAK
uniref:Hydroxymethylglutaryl-CoA reductase-like domain-containing protein n=1 Tax=Thermofilum adornatum TaxID=1365176 RepID=A0A7C1GBI5_9CREN